MIRVGVVGAQGYGGREFMRLLMAHPGAELAMVVGRRFGMRVDAELPAFRGFTDLMVEEFDAAAMAARCDVVFLALPGKESMPFGAALYEAGVKVMDLGSDFRIKDPAVYEQYYGAAYTRPDLVSLAVYGHVPWYREQIKEARIVAVPGCFPISVITPLKPLLRLAAPQQPVVVNAISGISGAGRTPNDVFHFPNMNENVRAYKLAVHQHVPEIEQELCHAAQVQFTPHVGPYTRGILSTIVLRPSIPLDLEALFTCYAEEPFVRVLGEGNIPDLNQVRASNFCDFGWKTDTRTGNIVIVSVIDNMVGGTAGMGLQCMNVAFGLDERCGLRLPGMAP